MVYCFGVLGAVFLCALSDIPALFLHSTSVSARWCSRVRYNWLKVDAIHEQITSGSAFIPAYRVDTLRQFRRLAFLQQSRQTSSATSTPWKRNFEAPNKPNYPIGPCCKDGSLGGNAKHGAAGALDSTLLKRVKLHRDTHAAAVLLGRWETVRDTMLLSSWADWASAVGVSVQLLQQVVIAAHGNRGRVRKQHTKESGEKCVLISGASKTVTQHPSPLCASKPSQATRVNESPRDEEADGTTVVVADKGILTPAAYRRLQILMAAEAALLHLGSQGSTLKKLNRPPSVREWAAVSAAETYARAKGVTWRTESDELRTQIYCHTTKDATSVPPLEEETRTRELLQQQLNQLHLLLSFQQRSLQSSAKVLAFRFHTAAFQRLRLRQAKAGRLPTRTSAAKATKRHLNGTQVSSEEELMLAALQHARLCLRSHVLARLRAKQTVANSATPAQEAQCAAQERVENCQGEGIGSSVCMPPLPSFYWLWMQQGMTALERTRRAAVDVPSSWWSAAAAVRRAEQEQRRYDGAEVGPCGELEKAELRARLCQALKMTPKQLSAIKRATSRPFLLEAEIRGPFSHKSALNPKPPFTLNRPEGTAVCKVLCMCFRVNALRQKAG